MTMTNLAPPSSTRRERQVVQITALMRAGESARAAGLTLEHAAEFPDDLGLLARAGGDARAYDVVVIGGGAAGLSAALVLGRARRRVAVIDAGSPRNAPAAHMQGFLSRDGMPPSDFLAAARAEVMGYGVEVLADRVLGIDRGYRVRLAGGPAVTARRILLATGVSDALPDLPGVLERWGRDLLHCPYCHGWEVRDQPLGVLGSHPGAVQHAQLVRQWSDDVVFFVHTLAVTAVERAQLEVRGIRVVDGEVARLVVDADRLTGVELVGGRVIATHRGVRPSGQRPARRRPGGRPRLRTRCGGIRHRRRNRAHEHTGRLGRGQCRGSACPGDHLGRRRFRRRHRDERRPRAGRRGPPHALTRRRPRGAEHTDARGLPSRP